MNPLYSQGERINKSGFERKRVALHRPTYFELLSS
jgi:hypothetical protein